MRIMQRKASNKLGIHANSLKPEKRQTTKKPSLQTHDGKSLGSDLKAKKMKKSRSMNRSELQGSLGSLPKGHETPRQPGKPPPLASLASPTKTPSPKKPTPSKSPYASPNYMKSTSSSEARKEQRKVSTSSSSKLQRVSKSLSRTSSLKKVRTLSFKHTRTGGNNKCSKVVLCENLDVERATCSSTLKDSKFPPYLMLNPGATEAEGTSAMRVCPYNYCSLNGHHHSPIPPLKCFLSSRRRLLKTQRVVRPEVLSPRKAKLSKKDVKGVDSGDEVIVTDMPVMPEVDQKDDFFVEIYLPGVEVAAASDQACSKIDSQNDLDQSEDTISLDDPKTPQLIKVDDSNSVSLDESFGENSGMEWEEGQFSATYLDQQKDVSGCADRNDQNEPDLKPDETVSGNLDEFMADRKLLPYYQDEIAEWLHFSDAGSMPDSESTNPGEEQIEDPDMIMEGDHMNTSVEDDAIISNEKVEVKSIDELDSPFSDHPTDETMDGGSEGFDCYQYQDEENHGDEAKIVNETVEDIGEENKSRLVIESTESLQQKADYVKDLSSIEQYPQAGDNWEAEFDDKKANRSDEEEDHSTAFKLHSNDDCVTEVKAPEMEDIKEAAEVDGIPLLGNKTSTGQIQKGSYCRKGTDPIAELLDNCMKLKKSMRRKKEDEEDEGREFNPRAPNFLPIEPEPEAERVDLRHQEMDERRNSDEWMLDYALQKTVNQLAPARKKKVALLVEAFESVLPIPKCEPHLRRNSSTFGHSRPIQACS